jgi:aminoglycoside phosphotransferase (APT) family kinase protein
MRGTDRGYRETLRSWVADVVGERSVELTRRPGGGRHQAWDVAAPDGRRWFLRADAAPPPDSERYTLRREAEIYRAVHAAGIPSPAVLAIHDNLEAVLLEHVAGEAAFTRLDPAAQAAIIADFAPWLARLHAADPASLDLPLLHPVRTIEEHVVDELDIWESRLDAAGVPDPVLTSCFVWLRSHVPATGTALPSLVQGDTGPGNFLHDGYRVTAFLDFELAHLGDPMEDLAWVGTRNAQEPVPDFEHFLALYATASGRTIDRDRIRYHALFAELRIAVLGAERLSERVDLNAEHGNQLIYGALHRRLTVEALAAASGRALPDVEVPPLTDTPETRLYDGLLHQLRETIAPHLTDPYISRRLKSAARVVKYLREVDRSGERYVAAELDDLAALLGRRPATVADGAAELCKRLHAGDIDPLDLLPYATAQVVRRTELTAPAMGVLASRHLPAI